MLSHDIQRKVALLSLGGSRSNHLDAEGSDWDWKVFVIPTFDDLYDSIGIKETVECGEHHYSIHDIRKLPSLLWKSNVNFIGVLFSNQMSCFEKYPQMEKFISLREDIACMNLPFLFDSMKGFYENYMFAAKFGKKESMNVFYQFGFDPKMAMNAYRVLDSGIRFYHQGFQGFGEATWYKGKERDFMMAMKKGEISWNICQQEIEQKKECFLSLKEEFYRHSANEKLKLYLENLIKSLVKEQLE